MFKRIAAIVLVVVGLAAWVQPAAATTISYTATNTDGTEWRYDYGLSAAVGEAAITEFTIYFGASTFTNGALRGLVIAAGWDGTLHPIDTDLPDDGYLDFVALPGGGVGAPGSTQAGFSVLFDWFGVGAPGSQPFDIVDAQSFALIRSGVTTPAGVATVPEPGATLLLALGLLVLGARIRRTFTRAR